MALKNQAITVTYVAWNTSTNAGQPGDAVNHTLKLVQDGTAAAPTNSPAEVDAVNAPGVYKLALTAGDMNFNAVTLCGKSSTANVTIIPVAIVTERGNLDATVSSRSTYAGADTPGTTTLLARLTAGRATNLDNLDAAVSTRSTYAGGDTPGTTTLLARLTATRAGLLDNLDAAISTRSTYAGGAVASVTAPVTVGTNNDKAGYSLAAGGLDSVVVEAGLNARQSLSIIAAATAGTGGTTSNAYKGAGVATTRITFTAAGGERSAVTLSPPV